MFSKSLSLTLLLLWTLSMTARGASPFYAPFNTSLDSASVIPVSLPNCTEAMKRAECKKKVTFTVFMAADNELTPFALWDLAELSSVGSDENVDVIVHLDLKGEDGSGVYRVLKKTGLFKPEFTISDYEKLKPTDFNLEILHEMPEIESLFETFEPANFYGQIAVKEDTSRRKLIRTLEIAESQFPSHQKITVLWGHGLGWEGFGLDESNRNTLSILEIKRAFKRTRHYPDLLITDSCLLQTFEVLTLLSGSAKAVTGTALLQIGVGLPYRRLLKSLKKNLRENEGNSEDSIRVYGENLPNLFDTFLKEQKHSGPPYSLSTISLLKWRSDVEPAFRRWSEAAFHEITENRLKSRPAFFFARDRSRAYGENSEISSFLKEIIRNEDDLFLVGFVHSSRDFLKLLESGTIRSVSSTELAEKSLSLSIYFPTTPEHWEISLPIMKKGQTDILEWNQFLRQIFKRET